MKWEEQRAYLDRIGYGGPPTPTLDALRALHHRHMLSVPFENLDIHSGRKIILDPERFIDKIVLRRRGGFCYENNGAFALLLAALGFNVTLLSARVAGAEGKLSPEFDHLTLQVDLEHSWLADVGFGESFVEPLRIAHGLEQQDPAGSFRLVRNEDRWGVERRSRDNTWQPQYEFSLLPRQLSDFSERCEYHQTSPHSHFVQNRICSLATPEGRATLSGMRLIVTSHGHREERELSSEAEWRRALQDHFGITLDA